MRILAAAVIFTALGARALAAQADTALARAFDLERHGSFAAAAEGYRAALLRDPGSVPALLGLERTLIPLDRQGELGPILSPIIRLHPTPELFAVALRGWVAAGNGDSARRVVEQWARVDGDSLRPYREWGDLLLGRRDAAGARRAYTLGRTASGDSVAFAVELAQAATLDGDLVGAAPDWVRATARYAVMRPAAVAALGKAAGDDRSSILRKVDGAGPAGRALGTLLLAAWGEPVEAVARVDSALATGAVDRGLLYALVGELRESTVAGSRGALGRALELLAGHQAGATGAPLRLEAAHAYADADDRPAARRMLSDRGQLNW